MITSAETPADSVRFLVSVIKNVGDENKEMKKDVLVRMPFIMVIDSAHHLGIR